MPDYGNIISKSFDLIKKNKWLFVWGMVLATFASGGSYNYSSNLSDNSSLENFPNNVPEDIPEKTSYVLGIYTNSILDWLKGVPAHFWIILFFVIVIALFFGWFVRILLTSWAKSGLIVGFQNAVDGGVVDLKNTASQGLKHVKSLIIFSLAIFLVFLALFLTLPLLWFLVYLIVSSVDVLKTLWIVIGVVGGLVVFIGSMIILSMVEVYAERLIVLRDYKVRDAWKEALRLSKGSFLPTLVMGVINSFLGFGIGCVSMIIGFIFLGIPAVIMIYPSITSKEWPSPWVIVSLVILFVIFTIANVIIKAFIVMFKYANWNQMYEYAVMKVEGKNEQE